MKIRIGTRGSPLAMAQAIEVRSKLMASRNFALADLPIVEIKTSGDRIQDRPLSEVGGKGLFTKEIEEALYSGDIDIAVHSMKDLETEMPPGLAIAAVLEREDVRDAFVSLNYARFEDLPNGATVGTSSLRRRAQVRNVRPDFNVVEFRGNVQTRLAKLAAGVADATFLACAGLRRLGQPERISAAIDPGEMLPAVAQGAIAIQMRLPAAADASHPLWNVVCTLDHAPTRACVEVERAFLGELDGSCRTPIAGLAVRNGAKIDFRGEILRPDGSTRLTAGFSVLEVDALDSARVAARELLRQAGPKFFDPEKHRQSPQGSAESPPSKGTA